MDVDDGNWTDPEAWIDPKPLHTAAGMGDLPTVRRLVAEGWDIDEFDDYGCGLTPLHCAVREEHFEVVAFLLEQGADVNAHDEPTAGRTPLADVAETCSLAMARLLIDAGANPLIRGGMGSTALDHSANRKRFEGPQVHALLFEAARRFGYIVDKSEGRKYKRNREE